MLNCANLPYISSLPKFVILTVYFASVFSLKISDCVRIPQIIENHFSGSYYRFPVLFRTAAFWCMSARASRSVSFNTDQSRLRNFTILKTF